MIVKKIKDKIQYILIIPILALIFLTMFYMDLHTTIQLSYVWVQSAFDGSYASFYNNALNAGVVVEGAVYDVGIYAVLGIWGIPIWLLNKICGVSIISMGSYLWFKVLLTICMIASLRTIAIISKKLSIYSDDIVPHMLSMFIFIVPILAVAQYDVIPLMLALLAIENGLEDINYKSIMLFALSFTMKPFTIFIFAIYLLVKEKGLFKLIKYGIASVIPFSICKLIYAFNRSNEATNNDFLNSKFLKLISVTIQDGHGNISVFLTILVLICIAAYCYRDKDTENKIFFILETILWISFCIFTPAYPYWVLYLCPFLVITAQYISGININIGMILEFVIELLLFIVLTISCPWVFGGSETMSYLVLRNVYITKTNVSTVYDFMCRFNINRYEPLIHAVLLASSIGFIVLSYRSATQEARRGFNNYKMLNYFRIASVYMWTLLCIAILFVAA